VLPETGGAGMDGDQAVPEGAGDLGASGRRHADGGAAGDQDAAGEHALTVDVEAAGAGLGQGVGASAGEPRAVLVLAVLQDEGSAPAREIEGPLRGIGGLSGGG